MPIDIIPAKLEDLETLLSTMREMQVADPSEEPFDELLLHSNLKALLENSVFGTALSRRMGVYRQDTSSNALTTASNIAVKVPGSMNSL